MWIYTAHNRNTSNALCVQNGEMVVATSRSYINLILFCYTCTVSGHLALMRFVGGSPYATGPLSCL